MQARNLDGQSRSELIARADLLGVEKASLLTRTELVDEIVRRTVADPIERRLARGLLGLARDLVASVVERGLHLPEAAAKIRAIPVQTQAPVAKPPIATVTLAEIYAAQGHRKRALKVLDEVLTSEPDHTAARQLHDAIASSGPDEPVLPPEPEDLSAPLPVEVAAPEAAPFVDPAPESPAIETRPAESRESNEIVLLPVDSTTVFVYWETGDETLKSARLANPEGSLVVRIVTVIANWHGPIAEVRDLETDLGVGEWFVRDLPLGAALRAAVGWRAADMFEPLAVAMRVSELPAVLGQSVDVNGADKNGAARDDAEREASSGRDEAVPASTRARELVARASASQGSASWVALSSAPAPFPAAPVERFAAAAEAR